MQVPFAALDRQHRQLEQLLTEAIGRVAASGAYAGGHEVARFEVAFAKFCGSDHAVGVGSGTEALYLTLRALDIGPGDEVITAPTTYIATVEAIAVCGATPVFVDVEPETGNLDVTHLPRAITPKTRAIIPVHLYGHPCDMRSILRIARHHDIAVVEDASQAHGALCHDRPVGAFGAAGCFSFYPTKNLGAYGDAGAIITNDEALAERLRVLREHGQSRRDVHTLIGWNARMDALHAAVLRVKLDHLQGWIARRRAHAASYASQLSGIAGVTAPTTAHYAQHAYHVYAVCAERRDELATRLLDAGIATRVHYPTPVHLQPAFAHLGYAPGSLPSAEWFAAHTLSLPMFAELESAEVDAVCSALWHVQQRVASNS